MAKSSRSCGTLHPSHQLLRAEVLQVWLDHCTVQYDDGSPCPSAGLGLVMPEGGWAFFSSWVPQRGSAKKRCSLQSHPHFHTYVLLPYQADNMEEQGWLQTCWACLLPTGHHSHFYWCYLSTDIVHLSVA